MLKKITVLLLCLCLAGVPLSGCGKDKTIETAKDNTPIRQTEKAEDGVFITIYYADIITQEQEDALDEDTDRDYTKTIISEISEAELNAETLVDQYNMLVIESLYGEAVVVNQVKIQGENVFVDFDGDSLESLGIEEGYEGQLFYNLARTICANLKDVDTIYLTMNHGKDFQLGHLWFDAGRPFYYGEGPSEE